MTPSELKEKQERTFEEKLQTFKWFRDLGDELFEGWVDYYDDVHYTDYGDYEDDVINFVETLTDLEHKGLQAFDPGFYMRLISYYRKLWNEHYEPYEESNTTLKDSDEDNINILHE